MSFVKIVIQKYWFDIRGNIIFYDTGSYDKATYHPLGQFKPVQY